MFGIGSMSIYDDIINNKEYCPALLIGQYSVEFKQYYRGKIFNVSTLEDVRSLVSQYYGIEDLEGRIMVLDGISFLSDYGQVHLLKFIEESTFPIVILSYYDKVSSIIKSRMKYVKKSSVVSISKMDFTSIGSVYDALNEKQLKGLDREKYVMSNCPNIYYLEHLSKDYSGSDAKINRIIGKLK